MPEDTKNQAERGTGRPLEGQQGMSAYPCKECTGRLFLEHALRKFLSRENRLQTKSTRYEGMAHRLGPERAKKGLCDYIPLGNKWCHEFLVCLGIAAKSCARCLN